MDTMDTNKLKIMTLQLNVHKLVATTDYDILLRCCLERGIMREEVKCLIEVII